MLSKYRYGISRRYLHVFPPVVCRLQQSIVFTRHIHGTHNQKSDTELITIHDTKEFATELVARMSKSEITSTIRLLKTTDQDARTRDITIKRAVRKAREHGYDWFYNWLNDSWSGEIAPFPMKVPSRKVVNIAEEIILKAIKTVNRYKSPKFLNSLVGSGEEELSIEEGDKQTRAELIQAFRQVSPLVCKEVSSLVKGFANEEITDKEFQRILRITCGPHSDIAIPVLEALGQPVLVRTTKWNERSRAERQESITIIGNLLDSLIRLYASPIEGGESDSSEKDESKKVGEEESEQEEEGDEHHHEDGAVAAGEEGEEEGHEEEEIQEVGKGTAAIKNLLAGLGKDKLGSSSSSSHNERVGTGTKIPIRRVSPLHCANLTFRCTSVSEDEFDCDDHFESSATWRNTGYGGATSSSSSIGDSNNDADGGKRRSKEAATSASAAATAGATANGGAAWNSSLKVFIENIPDGLDEDGIRESLRTCGKVGAVKLFQGVTAPSLYDEHLHPSEEGEHDTPAEPSTSTSSSTTTEIVESTTTASAATRSISSGAGKGGTDADTTEEESSLRLNPLGLIAAGKKKRLKKGVIRAVKSDNYAFVMMSDDEGYSRIVKDDVRIFGLCIKGNNCRVQPVGRLRTLVIELKQSIDLKQVDELFTYIIGPAYKLSIPDDLSEFTMPVFITLEFNSHDDAWRVHEAFSRFVQNPLLPDGLLSGPRLTRRRKQCRDEFAAPYDKGYPLLSVAWIKSKWFWTVTNKGREISLDREAASDFAVLSAAAADDSNEEEKEAARKIMSSPRFLMKPGGGASGMPEDCGDDSLSANDSIGLDDLLDVDIDSSSPCL